MYQILGQRRDYEDAPTKGKVEILFERGEHNPLILEKAFLNTKSIRKVTKSPPKWPVLVHSLNSFEFTCISD